MEFKNKKILYVLFVLLALVIAVFIGYISFLKDGFNEILFENKDIQIVKNIPVNQEELDKSNDFQIDSEIQNQNIIDDSETTIENPSLQEQFPQEQTPVDDTPVDTPTEVYACGLFPCYSSTEFLDLYSNFEKNGTLSFLTKYIYNIPEVDDYIRAKAEARGYQQRGFADEKEIISFEGTRTLPMVKNAYIKMRDAMAKENIRLHFVSAYRSSVHQRSIFTNKLKVENPNEILTGIHDGKIDEILTVSSIPGYSKHHSGYAVDFGCGNNYLVYTFNETECYGWLSKNNFENAKRFGFIPSYPEEGGTQGPNPEPWEYVWVGSDYIKNPTM